MMYFFLKTSQTSSSAQLWQRDHLMLASFSINVQLYSQIHKIALLSHAMAAPGAIQAVYLTVLMQRNFVAEFYGENVSFIPKTLK